MSLNLNLLELNTFNSLKENILAKKNRFSAVVMGNALAFFKRLITIHATFHSNHVFCQCEVTATRYTL